jgi:UDP-N-acetylmuramate--alanine ligase
MSTATGYAKKRTSGVSTYGFMPGNTYRIINYETTPHGVEFDLLYEDDMHVSIKTGLYGEKNILNTAGVVALLLELGFAASDIKNAIIGFVGPKRRMEVLFSSDDYVVVDDYGHHPDEIRAVIQALRARFIDRRLVVLFQPHTFSRTKALLQGFAESLSLADVACVAPIFPSAREDSSQFSITSFDVEQKARGMGHERVVAVASKDALTVYVKEILKKGDVICTMGAGDIYAVADDIISYITNMAS